MSNHVHIVVHVDPGGRRLHPGKHGMIGADVPPPLPNRLLDTAWLRQVRGIESRYCRAIGSAHALLEKASAIGQRCLMVRRVERVSV